MNLAGRRALLAQAKARLDRLDLYPRPVSIARARIIVWPALFRLPWMRRFEGYAAWNTILLRETPSQDHADLICHELCHVWQMQHHPIGMPLSYLRSGYAGNRFEAQARTAVEQTRS